MPNSGSVVAILRSHTFLNRTDTYRNASRSGLNQPRLSPWPGTEWGIRLTSTAGLRARARPTRSSLTPFIRVPSTATIIVLVHLCPIFHRSSHLCRFLFALCTALIEFRPDSLSTVFSLPLSISRSLCNVLLSFILLFPSCSLLLKRSVRWTLPLCMCLCVLLIFRFHSASGFKWLQNGLYGIEVLSILDGLKKLSEIWCLCPFSSDSIYKWITSKDVCVSIFTFF